MTLDLEPITASSPKLDLEPISGATPKLDLEPIAAAPKSESPTPASDKALSETPVSPVDARLASFGVDTAAPESFYKPEEHPMAEAIAQRGLAFAEGAGVPTSLQGLKEMGKFLIRSPIQDVKDIYGDITQIPSRIANFGQTIAGSPAATVYREPLSSEAFGIYGTAAGMLAPALAKKGVEYAKPISETAPIHGDVLDTGRPQEGAGQMPVPESGTGVQTRGQGQVVAEPPQETPQPVAAKPETPTPQGQPSQETGVSPQTASVTPPSFAARFDPETLLIPPRWAFDKYGKAFEDKIFYAIHNPDKGVDITPIWKEMTPAERQELDARGFSPLPSRKYGQVILQVKQEAVPARNYYRMQEEIERRKLVSQAAPVPEGGQTATVSGGKPEPPAAPALTSPESADVGAVPVPVVADETHVSAIANRFIKERADRGELGQITPGRGFSRDDLVFQGLKMPPEEINQHVSDLMQGTGDIVKQGQAVRVEEARLDQRSKRLSKLADADPKNVDAQMAADNAFKDWMDFHNGPVAQLKQKWHATGLEMQGEIPVDLSTYNGLRQQWLRDVGEAPPAKVEPELRRTAQNVSKAIEEDNGARSKLSQAIDKESTRRKYPTADEVRNNIRERMGLEPCRT